MVTEDESALAKTGDNVSDWFRFKLAYRQRILPV